MKITIIIALSIINIFAIFMLYKIQNVRGVQTKMVTTLVLVIVTYIIVKVIYGIASVGIGSEVINNSRNFIEFAFLPINIIALDFPLTIIMNKERNETRSKKIAAWTIIAIIIATLECSFIKSTNLDIVKMQNQIKSNTVNQVD